jgi:transcriptional regulator with XRE-family HTH domain
MAVKQAGAAATARYMEILRKRVAHHGPAAGAISRAAKDLGITRSYAYQLLNGRRTRVGMEVVGRAVERMGLSADYFERPGAPPKGAGKRREERAIEALAECSEVERARVLRRAGVLWGGKRPKPWASDAARRRYIALVHELAKEEEPNGRGWQRRVAERLGVHYSYVNKIMRGERQSVGQSVIDRAVDLLGLDPAEFQERER